MCTPDKNCRFGKVSEVFVYENFMKVPAETVEAGDICAVCGIDDVLVCLNTPLFTFHKSVMFMLLSFLQA